MQSDPRFPPTPSSATCLNPEARLQLFRERDRNLDHPQRNCQESFCLKATIRASMPGSLHSTRIRFRMRSVQDQVKDLNFGCQAIPLQYFNSVAYWQHLTTTA